MKVWAGLYNAERGFLPLHYIDAHDVGDWLLCMDCSLYQRSSFDWDGELVPVRTLCPIVMHDHGLDRKLNNLVGVENRGVDWRAKPLP